MQLPELFHSKNALFIQTQASALLESNTGSQKYGLSLKPEGALTLITERNRVLKNVGRIELEANSTLKIIQQFCDSSYIQQDDYVAILVELQEIFKEKKNETEDSIADDELLVLLKDYYNKCDGDLELLKGKYLDELIRTTRRHNQVVDFDRMAGDE